MADNTISYKNKTYRNLMFTIWLDKLPQEWFQQMPEALPDGVRLLAYQQEVCPDTGRDHIQVGQKTVDGAR